MIAYCIVRVGGSFTMILKHFEGGLHCQMGPLPLRYENVRRKNSQLTSYEGPAVVKEARRSLTMSLSVRTALARAGHPLYLRNKNPSETPSRTTN